MYGLRLKKLLIQVLLCIYSFVVREYVSTQTNMFDCYLTLIMVIRYTISLIELWVAVTLDTWALLSS